MFQANHRLLKEWGRCTSTGEPRALKIAPLAISQNGACANEKCSRVVVKKGILFLEKWSSQMDHKIILRVKAYISMDAKSNLSFDD